MQIVPNWVKMRYRRLDETLTIESSYPNFQKELEYLLPSYIVSKIASNNDAANQTTVLQDEGLDELDKAILDRSFVDKYMYKSTALFLEKNQGIRTLLEYSLGFNTLCNLDVPSSLLKLWDETFLHLDQKSLPNEQFTDGYIAIIQSGGNYKELSMYTSAAVSLIEYGDDRYEKDLDELINKIIHLQNEYPNESERKTKLTFIRDECHNATTLIHPKLRHETSFDKLILFPGRAAKFSSELAYITLRLFMGIL